MFPNIKWRYDGGRVVAASVWDENIRGIAPSDRIVSVDGVPCGKISLCDYIGLRVRDGSALEVETRDGTRRTVIAKAVPRRL